MREQRDDMAAFQLASVGLALVVIMLKTETFYAQNSAQDYLDAHNGARKAIGLSPFVWSNGLETYARNYANQRIGDCRLVHSRGPYGENLFWGSGKSWSASEAVKLWISESVNYDYYSNYCKRGTVCGHYTQVVWRNTRMVGCAHVVCRSGAIFIICNYYPPGNYIGQRPY